MDSYDLFGEDVTGSVLAGLDLGSNNYDPSAASRGGGEYQQQQQQAPSSQQQQQQQQHAYPAGDAGAAAAIQKQQSAYMQQHPSMQKQPYPHMPQDSLQKQSAAYPHLQPQQAQSQQQESPLQKLASFGGDFPASSNHMDPSSQAMYHQNHSGYGDTTRPIHPSSAASSMSGGYVRSIAPQAQATGQYGYGGMDNMYSMDQSMGMSDSSSMQGWNSSANYRQQAQHYSQMSQGGYRQPHMGYQDPSTMGSQTKLPPQQYPNQQGMMGSMMQSHQSIPPTSSYSLAQQQQRMPLHQASQQQPSQQQPPGPQQQQYHAQNSQSMSYPSGNAGYGSYGPMHQAGSRMPPHVQYPGSQSQMQMPDMSSGQSQSYSQGFGGFGQPQPTPQQPSQQAPSQPQQAPPQQQIQTPAQAQPQQPQASQPPPHQQPASQSQQPGQQPTQQALIRPIGVDVGPSSQYPSSQKGPQSGIGGASPQYRAPFPQLSPQMSPRAQQPQQMSPRPVMSPAKPSTLSPHPHATLSPRPKSATPTPQASFPSQQSTLQALEQMVMPQVPAGSDYPGYGPRSQMGQPQSSPLGPRTPVSPQWPQQGGNRSAFSMNGSMGMVDSQSAATSQPSSGPTDTTGASAPQPEYSPAPGTPASAGEKEGTKTSTLSELNGPQSQPTVDPNSTAAGSGPDSSSMLSHGNMNASYPSSYSSYMGANSMPYGSKPGEMLSGGHVYAGLPHSAPSVPTSMEGMHSSMYGAQPPPQGPGHGPVGPVASGHGQSMSMMGGEWGPGPGPGQGPPAMSHQQEMAALQQQIQELYCMPPGPEHQKIPQLQSRLSLLQRHEMTDRCSGGPQCMLSQQQGYGYGGMEAPGPYQQPAPTGRGKGRAKSTTPRAKKPRSKKAQQELLMQQQMEAEAAAAAAARAANYNMGPVPGVGHGHGPDMGSPPYHPGMGGHMQPPPHMAGMPPPAPPHQQHQQHQPHLPPHLAGHMPGPGHMPHHMAGPGPGPGPGPDSASGPPPPMGPGPGPGPGSGPGQARMGGMLPPHLGGPVGPGGPGPGPGGVPSSQAGPMMGMGPVPAPGPPPSLLQGPPPPQQPPPLPMQPLPSPVAAAPPQSAPSLQPSAPPRAPSLPPQMPLEASAQPPIQPSTLPPLLTPEVPLKSEPMPPSLGGPQGPPMPSGPQLSQLPQAPQLDTSIQSPSFDHNTAEMARKVETSTPVAEIKPENINEQPLSQEQSQSAETYQPVPSPGLGLQSPIPQPEPKLEMPAPGGMPLAQEYPHLPQQPVLEPGEIPMYPMGGMQYPGQMMDGQMAELDADGKLKGGRKPRSRKPKEPKEPKEAKTPKAPKEKTVKEPKAPKEPKLLKEPKAPRERKERKTRDDKGRRRTPKKRRGEGEDVEPDESQEAQEGQDPSMADEEDTPPAGGDDETIESAPATDGDTTLDSTAESSPLKSKSRNRKSKGVVASKVRKSGSSSSRRKKRKKEYEKDDDEVDDVLLATPPASPEEDAEGSVLKRRSARNTHRKKYVDDDMLRFSDDEEKNSKPAEPKQKTESAVTKVEKVETPEQVPVKPNYVYINPGDEDTMVVQHILAVRKGRRELKKDPEPAIENEAEKEPPGTAEEKPDSSDTNVDAEKESQDSETCDNAVDKPKGNDATEEGDGSGAGDVTKGDSASNDEKVLKAETDSSEKDQPVNESSKEETDDNVKDDKMDVDTPAEEQGSVETSRSEDQKTEVKTEVKKEDKSDEKEDEEDEKEEAKQKPAEPKKTEDKDEEKEWVEVDEFYVKYRNFSYLHCEWKTEEELLKGDKRVQGKIKRFLQKQAHLTNIFENLEEDPFNPDYVEVDRVLDVSEQPDPNTGNSVKHYLVKWRALQYEDSTWELEEDIDPLRIQEFERFRKLPPRDQWRPKKRPSAEEWRRLPVSPVFKNGNTLREYQLEGLNWLMFSWYNGRNCILADEMGLGKTIQSLTFVHSVYKYGIRGPFLVIAPLSTIPNWQREFEAWTDLNVVVYHGSGASRNMLMEYELYFRNDKGQTIRDLAKFNVLITTFEMIITDVAELKTFNWRLCVIDEAHRLKNRNCKLLEGLRSLKLEHRVLLSGTPLQNNVNELFSLLNFLEPSQFTSSEAFLQEFGALKSDTEVNKLQSVLKPMMLRRLKEDVEKSIAPKEETVVEVELTNIQKKYYRGILERNFSFLSKGTTSNNVPNLMNTMMELRKCCIHPYLLNGAEDQIQYDYKIAHGEDPDAYYKALINSSGKMVLIDKLLPKLKSNGHRVLIFSQMVRCLDILEDYLMYQKYQFERIDGRIRGNLRQAAIDRFCKPDSDRFVFLLCTKAGGQGINLTAADTVIIFDSDWNPQNDLQAQARCHRIGQQKMVKVYRLLCRNTYEREMFDKASLKLGLDKAILQSMNTSQSKDAGGKQQLTKKEIEDLLKKGAYGAIMDEDNAGDKFCEEDIDQILERRTQIITLESEKGSTFSKASFACSTARQDIDVDDPDFWKKWAKKAEIDTTEKCEEDNLVISEPRRRTQIKRYGHDESTLNMSELESSNSDSEDEGEEDGSGRRGRKRDKKRDKKRRPEDHVPREGEIAYGSWDRSECFKVERGLLTFGWARWKECLASTQFRKGWTENAYEDCARVILLYCLRFYRGDEKIRSFIWDLITPAENGQTEVVIHKNHSGLNSPVPRGGRKPKKSKSKEGRSFGQNNVDKDHWSNAEKYDGDFYLEPTYKKHLLRHANKVLLRVRMLYYIKHEVLQDVLAQIAENVPASTLPVHPPPCDLLPVPWWDSDADRSLLIGTYKHGYENYTAMRNDPALGFLARVGPMDPNSAVLGDSNSMRDEDKLSDEDEEGGDRRSRLKGILKTPEDVDDQKDANGSEEASNTGKSDDGESKPSSAAPLSPSSESPANDDTKSQTSKELEWPSAVDLNTRLRRVITAYQRNFKKQELAQMQKAKKMERREKIEQIVRERERQRLDCSQKKWSRREEADFLRAISMYGVETDRKTGQLDWTKFRSMAHLEKKYDDTMTEYYRAFCAMLKRTCGKKLTPDEEMSDMSVESLSEERARKLLERLELLSKIREDVLHHPKLDDRLRLCRTSADMPEWWIPGRHDKDLLLGVAKHGLVRTDHYILNDPDLSFQKIIRKLLVGESLSSPSKVKKELEPESKNSSGGMKLERPEDILRMDKGEILVKLEKGEGTLRIEKLGLKSEVDVSIKSEKDDIKPSVKKEPEEASDKAKPSSEREASESKQEDSINEETQSKEEASDKTAKETDANKDETGEEGKPKEGGEVCEESPVEEKKPSDTSNEDPADKKEPSPTDEKEKEKKVDDEEMEVEPMKEKEKEVPETEGTADIESIPKESKEIEGVEKAVPTDEKLTLDPDVKEGAEETPKAEKTEVQDEEMPDAEKEPKTNEEKESGGEKVDKEDSSEDKPEKPSEDVDKSANSEEPSLEKKDEPPQDNLPKESEVVDEKKEETCVDVAEKEAEKEPQDEGSKTVEEVQSVEEGKADKSSKNEDEEATDNKTKDKSNSSPDNADVKIEKEIRGKVQSELQALYPDIEVVHPLSRLPEIDTIVIDPPKGITSQHSQGQHFNQRPSFGSQSPFNQQAFAQLQQSLQGMNSAQALQQLQSMEKLDPSVSQLLAQSFQSQIKWPKDIAIETRLQHIVHCVEKGEWPVSRNFSVFQSSVPQLPVVLPPGVTATIPNNHSNSNIDVDLAYIETVNNDRRDGASTPYSDSSDIITITTDNGSLSSQYPQFMRKRKRHIAIDVETERAKLHALLNSTNSNQHQSSHLGYRTDRDRYDRQDRNDRSYDRAYDRQQQQQHQHQLERQQRQMKEYERHHLMERQQQLERAAQLMEKVDRRQPTPQPKQSPLSWDDDSPSDDSRRSTPAHQPPPAHQQGPRVISMPYDLGKFTVPSKPKPAPQPAASPAPSPSSSSGAIDLSGGPPKSKTPSEDSYGAAGEDEAQDFSMGRKRKSSKLDDMLGKLMQKKNVPVPADEPVVGKEMKRRKLDEIVMGLSAAKEQQYPDPMLKRRSPAPMIPPGVTVTPASSSSRTPTPTHSSSGSSSKPPFSITVTSVQPPHSQSSSGSSRTASNSNASSSSNLAKDAYSSYLAQAEQHNLLLKQHQLQQQILQQQKLLQTTTSSSTQRKTYEAMLADINKAAELTSKLNSYSQSQDAKVNKWLSEQAALLPEAAGLGADFLPRRRRPRVDPTLLDWKKLTGEENVSVINRLTQKKLTGNKAPPLKHLAQWLLENPMFDVDPKWAELVKERGNLPHDLQKRLPGGERKKPGRPPILPSPSSQSTSSSSASQVASQAMNFQGLGSLNPSLLSSMAQNNPFLLPFAGLPNMNAAALGSMSGLGNLSNLGLSSSLFANLASLGLPGLSGMDAAALTELLASAGTTATPTASSSSSSKKTDSMHSSSHGQDRDKDRDRRDDRDRARDQDRGRDRDRDRGSSGVSSSGSTSTSNSKSASASASASAAAAAANSLAYLFPNPNLLYSPLGMSGLSPFSYESLAQQVGLLNGSLASTASTPTSSRSTSSASAAKTQSSSSRMSTPISSASSVAANNRHQREALERQHQQLQQFLLPQDTKLLESLSKSRLGSSSTSASDASRSDDRARRSKAEADNLRHLMAGIPAAYSASDPSGKRSREQLERDTLNRLYDSMTESMLRSSSSSDHRVRDSLASVTSVGHTSQSHSSSRGSSSSDPYAKSREVLMKEAMDKYGHVPTDLIIRSSLSSDRGSDRGSERSSERTSSSSTSDSSKRPRDQVVKEALESLGQSLASGALAKQSREAIQMASLLGSPSWDLVMRGAGSSSDKRKVDAAALAAMELLSPAKSEGRSSGSREERVEKEDRGKDLRSRREDERSWAEDKSRRSQDDRDKSKARPMDVQDLSTDLSITTVSSKSSKETGAAPAEPSDVAASGSDITSERPAKRAREPDDAATAAALDMASKRVREDKPEESEPEVRPEARASPAPARPEVAAAEPDAVAMSVTSDDHDAGADAADATGDTGDAKASDEPQDAPSGSGPSGQEEGDAEEQSKSARGQRRRAKSKVEEEAPVVERKVLRSSAGRAAAAAAARAAREQAEQAAASARSREESESYEA